MSKLTDKVSVSKRKLLLTLVSIALICSMASGSIMYVVAQGTALSTTTISGGPYPGAPSYTIFTENGVYYAKDAHGSIAFSSTNAATMINTVITTTPFWSTLKLVGNITIQDTILINKPITFIFDVIDLASSMITNCINVTVTQPTAIQGNTLSVSSGTWNASALCFYNSRDVTATINNVVYTGDKTNSRHGIGVDFYSDNAQGTYSNSFHGYISYFYTGVALRSFGAAGFVNQNWLNNVHLENNGNINLLIYNDGDGVGGNNFNVYTEPPIGGVKTNYYLIDGTNVNYPAIESNEFTGCNSYDLVTGATDYYATENVVYTRFIGGFINFGYWNDSGIGTSFAGVFDWSSKQTITTVQNQVSAPITYFSTNAGWTSAVTGSGATTQAPSYLEVNTGATGSSTAKLSTFTALTSPVGTSWLGINTDRRFDWSFTISRHDDVSSSNEIAYLQIKNKSTIGELDDVGLEFLIIGNELWGRSFASGLATAVDLGSIGTTTTALTLTFNPLQSIQFTVNGILKGTITSQVPSSASLGTAYMVFSIQNGATAQWCTLDVGTPTIVYR